MNDDDKDPMLSGDTNEQRNYRDNVTNVMHDTIEDDRRNRKTSSKLETPAILLGGTGLSSGLNQSL